MSPGISENAETPQIGEDALKDFWDPGFGELSIHEVWAKARQAGVPPCVLAALDIALWDWYGKKYKQPLYRIFGTVQKDGGDISDHRYQSAGSSKGTRAGNTGSNGK